MMNGLVDQRIVEMKFDAGQFTDGVAQSILSIDNLKKALNFTGIGAGIDKLGAAIGGITLSPLSNGIEEVTSKFSMLQYMGLKALTDIANAAVSAGERMVKSVSVDQVAAGWDKYAQKTESVQTIVSATKKSVDEVEEQLDKLNWFTDETSYNFTDMVQNIGKFTNNGVELKAAVTSMEGISTWAASAGANVGEASRAMYNLSQAMSVGSVKLIDWKSIENANMATQEFKQTAIDAAVALGTLKEKEEGVWTVANAKKKTDTDVSLTDFNSALSQEWFTSDVLQTSLKVYGNFTDALQKAVDDLDGIDSTVLLQWLDDYREGTLDWDEAIKKTGKSEQELKSVFKDLTVDISLEDALDQASESFRKFNSSIKKTDILDYLDQYNNGTKTIDEIAEATKVDADVIEDAFYKINHSGFDLGEKAFRMAQEAKTFQEAIDSAKDAVSTKWMSFFQTIFGNYEEAKVLWTDLSISLWDIFAGPIDTLDTIAESWAEAVWKEAEGEEDAITERERLIEAWYTFYENVSEIVSNVKESFLAGIFGDTFFDDEGAEAAQVFVELTERFHAFAESIKPSDELLAALGQIFEGLGKVIGTFGHIFGNVFTLFFHILGVLSPLVTYFAQWISVLTGGIFVFDNWLTTTNLIDRAFEILTKVIDKVVSVVSELFNLFVKWTGIDFSFLKLDENNDVFSQWEKFTGIVGDLWHKFEEFTDIDIKMPDFSKVVDAFGTIKAIWDESLYKATAKSFLTQTDPLLSKLEKVYLLVTNIVNGIYSTFLSDGKWINFESFDQFLTHFDYIKDVGGSVIGVFKELVGIFFDFFKSVSGDGEATFSFSNALTKLGGAVKKVLDFFKPLGDLIFKAATAIKTFLANLREQGVLITIVNTIKTLWGYLTSLLSTLGSVFSQFVSGAKDAAGAFDFQKFLDILKGVAGILISGGFVKILFNVGKGFGWLANAFAAFGKSGEGVANILEVLSNGIGEGGSGIVSSLNELIDGVMDSFKEGDIVSQFKKIAISIAILVGALFVLSTIDGPKLLGASIVISELMANLFGSIWGFYKMGGASGNEAAFKSLSTSMIKLGAAILLISWSVKSIAKLDQAKAWSALGIVTILMGEVFAFSRFMKASETSFLDSAKSMVKISIAILILSQSVKSLGKLETDQAIRGVGALAAIFVIIGAFIYAMGRWAKPNLTKEVGQSLKQMAIGVLALCASVYILGKLDTDQLKKGLGAVAAIILAIGVFAKLSEKSKGFVGKGLGIILMAAAMLIFANAVNKMKAAAADNAEAFLQGLVGLLIIMVGLTAAFLVLQKVDVVKTAAGFILVGKAMTMMASALFVIGNIPIPALIAGFIAMAASLIIFGVAVTSLAALGPAILFVAGGFALMALGLLMLGPALIGITAGLLALGGALPIIITDFIAAAGIFLTGLNSLGPILVGILTKLIEIVCSVIVGSVGTIVTTILTVAAELFQKLSVLVPQIIHFATMLILGLIYGLIASMDAIIQAGIDLMVSFLNGMANGLRDNQAAIIGAVANLLSSIIEMFIYTLQVIAEKIPGFGQDISDALEEAKQQVHETLVTTTAEAEQAGTAATEGYSSATSGIAGAAATAMGNALSGIQSVDAWDALGLQQGNSYMDSLQSTINGAMTGEGFDTTTIGQYFNEGAAQGMLDSNYLVTDAASTNTEEVLQKYYDQFGINSPSTKGIEIGMYLDQGIAQGMRDNQFEIFNVITEIFDAYMVSSEDQINQVKQQGIKLINTFVTGMRSKMPSVTSFFRTLSNSGALYLGMIMQMKFYGYGKNVVQGLVNGMDSKLQAVRDKARQIHDVASSAYTAASEIASPSKVFFRFGEYTVQGLVNGIHSMLGDAADASTDLGMATINAMSDAVHYAAAIAEGEIELSPTIKPVMDLTYVQDGIAQINSLQTRTLALDATVTTSKWDTIDKLSTRLDVSDQSVQAIVKKLSDQSAKLDGLIDLLSGTNIVLDGDVVVGKLLPKIDKGLGRRAKAVGGRR